MTTGVEQIMSGAESSLRLKREAKIEAWRDGSAPERTLHAVRLGDARRMAEVREPVHLVVTSPPYFNLVDYDGGCGDNGQLGGIDEYESFLDQLDRVWRRCFDLLTPGGRLCVVVGSVCISRRAGGRHHVLPLPADISVRARWIGFDYLTPIQWYKIANMATEAKGVGFLGKPYEPNAIVKNDIESILMLRKPGSYRKPTAAQRALSLIDPEDHRRWFRSIWDDIRGEPRRRGHPAPFPVELASRLVQMFSFVGDTVLDPFWGTGTMTAAAMLTARSSIGYEIEPRYLDIGRARLDQLDAMQVPATLAVA